MPPTERSSGTYTLPFLTQLPRTELLTVNQRHDIFSSPWFLFSDLSPICSVVLNYCMIETDKSQVVSIQFHGLFQLLGKRSSCKYWSHLIGKEERVQQYPSIIPVDYSFIKVVIPRNVETGTTVETLWSRRGTTAAGFFRCFRYDKTGRSDSYMPCARTCRMWEDSLMSQYWSFALVSLGVSKRCHRTPTSNWL